MATMNISLPDDLRAFVEAQTAERGFMSSSEYLRSLIREAWERARVEALLLEGVKSPLGPPNDESVFERMDAIARGDFEARSE